MNRFFLKILAIFVGLTVVSNVFASQKPFTFTIYDTGDDSDSSYSVNGSAIDVRVIEHEQEKTDTKSCMKVVSNDTQDSTESDQKKSGSANGRNCMFHDEHVLLKQIYKQLSFQKDCSVATKITGPSREPLDIGSVLVQYMTTERHKKIRKSILTKLVKCQKDINAQDVNGNTLLHLCMMFGYVWGVERLLELADKEPFAKNIIIAELCNKKGQDALHCSQFGLRNDMQQLFRVYAERKKEKAKVDALRKSWFIVWAEADRRNAQPQCCLSRLYRYLFQ